MELNGGTSSLYKKGDTVYRKQKENSETVHRLLKHLKNKGFDKAPEFLGIDGEYEMLSFVDGECFEPEEYPFTNDEEQRLEIIRKTAKLLREYHDSTTDFEVKETDKWWLTYKGGLSKEVICHNDFATYNVTFVDGLPYGMIDFDTCTPAPRIWDIAYAVYRFVPLSELQFDADLRAERKYTEKDKEFRKKGIKAFFESYGMAMPDDFCETIKERLMAMANVITDEIRKGNEAFLKMMEEGHYDFYLREIEFIDKHFNEWI